MFKDSDLGEGVRIYDKDENGLALFGTSKGTPPVTTLKFSAGAMFIDLDNKIAYLNTGTSASPSWNSMHEISAGEIPAASIDASKLSAAEAVTATADGLTTGLVSTTARHITVTSASADNIVTLPAASVGKEITGYVGANGCELRTPAASGVKINDVDSDGTNEAAIPATTYFRLKCVAADLWILEGVTELGADIAAIVPDAA